ncbi:MAG: SGNH/GDSL hydrolase family protein [Planctomycetaceae bacterium]|nr:SGNH/GDSL hydrolase family protein [Planctomycetaceae bacterium]
MTLLVLFLAGSAEIGLRLACVLEEPTALDSRTGNSLITPCWQAQYQLRPLSLHHSHNPDTLTEVALRTNEWGTRGGNYTVPKPKGVFRILNIGDETTLSAAVTEEETFSQQLQMTMQPLMKDQLEVINAGVPGYCPLLAYLKLKHTLMVLEPDLVIYHFNMNDIADDYRARRQLIVENGVAKVCPHPDLVNSTQPQQKLTQQLMLIQRGSELWATSANDTGTMSDRLDIGSSQGHLSWILDTPPDWSMYINHALEPLSQMRDLVENSKGLFLVSVLPQPWQVSADACNGKNIRANLGLKPQHFYANDFPFLRVKEYCMQHGLRVSLPVSTFRQQQNAGTLFLQNAAELSPRGHSLYSNWLAQNIYQQYQSPQPNNSNSTSPPN